MTDDNGTITGTDYTDDDVTANITFTVQVVEDVDLALDSVRKAGLNNMAFNRVTGGTVGEVAVGEVAGMAFALPAIDSNKDGNGVITPSLMTECKLNNASCTGAVTTVNGNETPNGLTFTAASGGTPAGLKGTFDNAGTYTVTYTVTDMPIANGTYQTPDIANTDTVTFTLEVAENSVPTLTSLDAISPGFTTREVEITLPVADDGDGELADSLSGMHTSDSIKTVMVATSGAISLSGTPATSTGLMFNKRADGNPATITGRLNAGTAGTFNLTYTVVDGDRNVKGECTSANTPPDCDTATVDLTLMVTDPMISLAPVDGVGNVADKEAVLLVQDEALLGTAMTLPMVGKGCVGSGEHEHEHHLRLDVGENA